MDDPYATLGVKHDASQDDIRRAYRELAKKHHPDLNPGNAKAEDRFETVAAANELLSDLAKRARYDAGEIDAAGQERPPQPSYRDYAEGAPGRRYRPAGPDIGWNAQDLGDMFGSTFGGDHRSSGDSQVRGQDERYSFTTDFLDAVTGATRRLTLPDGRTLDVKLPPGTSDGQVLRLRGQGGAGWNGGPSGDALVEIAITPHRFFTRAGKDIRLDLPTAGVYVFREIDVARVRLIRELRYDLQVNEEALPIVLSLLDQLYDARRRMRELGQALDRVAPFGGP